MDQHNNNTMSQNVLDFAESVADEQPYWKAFFSAHPAQNTRTEKIDSTKKKLDDWKYIPKESLEDCKEDLHGDDWIFDDIDELKK
jgi:hypothetical protein